MLSKGALWRLDAWEYATSAFESSLSGANSINANVSSDAAHGA